MIKEIVGIMILGIVSDILVTLYYIFVGRLQAIPASLLTILITLLNFFIIEKVVISTNWVLIAAYAFGCSFGCFSIIMLQKSKLKKI
ncbi:MAG: hypothetical protein NTU63_02480 [Candidatus Pacearchaeota archaeon]|nr:hypothetical protein [Candidatus Pacearchaeota archaeon]